ncbi:hypothetical protein QN277_005785 [Acacia crassicarpa]|uniref:R13L1/DRL21-like LRR repeat region domain-containing protein n=1 Tax=Acacia crassicarpa TaxID=499986 RepID=A0AAE1IYQ2_9FABA|nr:hypothetical protein QN277_005785 [Acacia crassicarpa]
MKKLVNLRYLDASHSGLQVMPRGIGELKKLHFLSDFVLDRVEGASIMELGGLQNLSSSLTIKNLQHVANGGEASMARLVDKQSVEILSLTWNDAGDIITSRDILDNLQPHVDLKCLHIYGYKATSFSNWLGCPLYCKMVQLILCDCFNCNLLPPLGQLPSLQILQIEGFEALMKISPEFYKRNDDTSLAPPFPSLEVLEIRNMPVMQEWGSSCPKNAFPQLKHLILKDCPRLSDNLPSHLPDLGTLRIDGCDQLASSIPRARSIYASGCKRMEFFGQHHFQLAESIGISSSCETLSCLSLYNFVNLQQLIMSGCKNLKSVVCTKVACQHLKHIKLIDCPNLESFPLEGLLAPNMTHLELEGCCNLKSLLDLRMNLPMLQHISLRGCPGIECVPGSSLPTNLMSLYIDHCTFSCICCSMEWQSLSCLTTLSINGKYDDNIQVFPAECLLPSSLTILSICNYPSLETLDCRGFVRLKCLQELRIRQCPKLQRITGQKLPACLTHLNIYQCTLFRKLCHAKNGEIWSKVSHIPYISIDNTRVL